MVFPEQGRFKASPFSVAIWQEAKGVDDICRIETISPAR